MFGEVVETSVDNMYQEKDIKLSGDNRSDVLSSSRKMTRRDDLFTFREMAEKSLELWEGQEEGVYASFEIPDNEAHLALCKDTEGIRLVDTYDAEPRKSDYDSNVEYLTALGEHRAGLVQARDMCAGCPILDQCRTKSVTSSKKKSREPIGPHNITPEKHLVWAGMTVADRRTFFDVFQDLVEKKYGSKQHSEQQVG